MIHFVVPFRSQRVSNNWNRTSKLCNKTLQSICNQNYSKFKVYLVCHERPKDYVDNKFTKVIKVDYRIPSSWSEMMKDKTKKIKRGLVEIKKSSEMRVGEGKKAVMVVDADDRVNHNLTRWVKNNQYGHGWYIKSGVVYPYGRSFVFTSYVLGNAFYKSCGTSYIAYCNEYNLPSDIKDDSIIPVPHHTIVSSMKKKGKPLKRLPFKGACYVTDTGDNHSGISFLRWRGRKDFLRQLLSIRPLVFYRKKFAIRKDS